MNRDHIDKYLKTRVKVAYSGSKSEQSSITLDRFSKAFSLLPPDILKLFTSDTLKLSIMITENLDIPFGMVTRAEGPKNSRKYTITAFKEQEEWPEDLFLGCFLRELGHVVCDRPPEEEWPQSRGDRARFKERLELEADAMVWRWGLKHYSLRHLNATYPKHWAERIAEDIEILLNAEKLH